MCGKFIALLSDNDPYTSLDDNGKSNSEEWSAAGAEVIMRHGKGHFMKRDLDREDLDLVFDFLGLDKELYVNMKFASSRPSRSSL